MRRIELRWAAVIVSALVCFTIVAAGAEPSPLQAKADALFASQDWENAVAAYEAVTKAEPGNGFAWFRLGISQRQLRHNEDALAAYERAEKAGFANVQLLASAGICHAILGHRDEAFEYLKRAVDQGLPPQVLESHDDLAALREDPGFKKLLAAAKRRAAPCENDPKYAAFDFWVGDWDVTIQGQITGHNRIEKILGGCLLVENWTSASGVSGKSFNYLDPSTGTWKQNWVSQNGSIVRYEGSVKDGGMHYVGENIAPDGTKKLARVTLEPIAEGRVHHLIEISTDGGETWNPSFDAVYVRRAEDAAGGQ